MPTAHFNAGENVEVLRRDDESGQLTYYPATVRRAPAKQKNKLLIEYRTLVSGSIPAKELVDYASVRPAPPTDYGAWFKGDDDVDVYSDGGWHRGIVRGILVNSKYLVAFARRSEGIVTEQCTLRHHREWDGRAWSPLPPPFIPQRKRSLEEPKAGKIKVKVKIGKKEEKEKKKKKLESVLRKGSRVEVKSDDVGFLGAWFGAIVIDNIGIDRYLVQYLNLMTEDQSGSLREVVKAADVRPYPPADQQPLGCYKAREKVDAWYNEGWWEGSISRVEDGSGKYTVYFPYTGDYTEFGSSSLRPHLEWVNGKWIKEKSAEVINNKEKSTNPLFGIGMEVETKSDEAGFQGAWFVGVIVGVLGKDRVLVQFHNLLTDDETDFLKEEVNVSDVRPRPPQELVTRYYGLLEIVDAWWNDAWWVGRVVRVDTNMVYKVRFGTNEELDVEHSELRPHLEWIGGKWCPVPEDWKL